MFTRARVDSCAFASPSVTCRMSVSWGDPLLINGPVGSPMVARFQTKFGHCWLVGSGAGDGDIKEGRPAAAALLDLSMKTARLVISLKCSSSIYNNAVASLKSSNNTGKVCVTTCTEISSDTRAIISEGDSAGGGNSSASWKMR